MVAGTELLILYWSATIIGFFLGYFVRDLIKTKKRRKKWK